MVAPERPALDKLLAEEVLVPVIKEYEDLKLRPFSTSESPAALVADSLLHAPHQPSDVTTIKLTVLPVWGKKSKAKKLVAAKVVQIAHYSRPVSSRCIIELGYAEA